MFNAIIMSILMVTPSIDVNLVRIDEVQEGNHRRQLGS